MAGENSIERRSNLLAAALRDRVDAVYHSLTEPVPAFRVPMPEDMQVKTYLALRESGQLASLRQSFGGQYDDEQVDRYTSHMERLAPKHAPQLLDLSPEDEF